jgi:AGZA family xanthine/uracil permease-like MFS transporter
MAAMEYQRLQEPLVISLDPNPEQTGKDAENDPDCMYAKFADFEPDKISTRRRPADNLLVKIEDMFSISDRGSSIEKEVRAGFITWVTMSYIVVVNPMILSAVSPGVASPIDFREGVRATCLSAAAASVFVGLTANLPFGLAAGMGLNSYFRYGVVGGLGMKPEAALACCFVQAVFFAGMAFSGAAEWLQKLVPADLKCAITAAVGIFQAFVGFQLMGAVVHSDQTLVTLGDLTKPDLWLGVSITLLMTVLVIRKVKGALLIGIFAGAVAANLLGVGETNSVAQEIVESQNALGELDFLGAVEKPHNFVMATMCFLFIVVFDTAGVQYGIGMQADLLDAKGELPGSKYAFLGSAFGTAIGAMLGTSPVIIHNESAAGVSEGAKTGLCAVVTGLLFLLSPMLVPFIELVPPVATAPVLVMVGAFMMEPIKNVDFTDLRISLPAFFIICITPLTYSIATGIFTGLVAYFLLGFILHVLNMVFPEQDSKSLNHNDDVEEAKFERELMPTKDSFIKD